MFRKKDIPSAYSLIEQGKRTVIVKDDWKENLLMVGIADPDFFLKQAFPKEENYFGRGALKIIATRRKKRADRYPPFSTGGKIKIISDLYF
jgi:hypothetical protein